MARRALPLLLPALLLLASLAPALAADTSIAGPIPAQVTVSGTNPTISFQVYSDPGYSVTTKEFTPQVPSYMKISVSTGNQLRELTITVDMFADSNANAVGTVPSSTSPETHIRFTIYFDETNDQWVLVLDDGASGGSTWSVSFDANQPLPDPNATTGDFYVVIKPGKTAREASSTETAPYADWDIVATASMTDTTGQTYSGQATDYGYSMYFYGEVQYGGTGIDFGTLAPGTSKVDSNGQTITVISNGYFNLIATSDAKWWTTVNGEKFYMILDTNGTLEPAEFKLEVDDQYDSNTGDLVSPVQVTNSTSTAQAFANGNPTTENGIQTLVYTKITLGTGIHSGTYTGKIYVWATDSG